MNASRGIVAARFRVAQLINVSLFLKLNPGTLPRQLRKPNTPVLIDVG
jgi:hypothetical protein